jgi:hypothetical protein
MNRHLPRFITTWRHASNAICAMPMQTTIPVVWNLFDFAIKHQNWNPVSFIDSFFTHSKTGRLEICWCITALVQISENLKDVIIQFRYKYSGTRSSTLIRLPTVHVANILFCSSFNVWLPDGGEGKYTAANKESMFRSHHNCSVFGIAWIAIIPHTDWD